jgi:hypothetical protein
MSSASGWSWSAVLSRHQCIWIITRSCILTSRHHRTCLVSLLPLYPYSTSPTICTTCCVPTHLRTEYPNSKRLRLADRDHEHKASRHSHDAARHCSASFTSTGFQHRALKLHPAYIFIVMIMSFIDRRQRIRELRSSPSGSCAMICSLLVFD